MRNDHLQPFWDKDSTEPSPHPRGVASIKALLFDFDGTLTAPGALDFPSIKSDIGCPLDVPILEHIQSMNDSQAQSEAMERLTEFEIRAARISTPNGGVLEIVAWLKQRGLRLGIITRNSRASVLCAMENFHPLGPDDFDLIITREDPLSPKPSGEGIRWAADRFRISPREMLMVGDYLFDCLAGKAAGAVTVLLDPGDDPRLRDVDCDYRISHLNEIKMLLEQLGCG